MGTSGCDFQQATDLACASTLCQPGYGQGEVVSTFGKSGLLKPASE